MGSPLPVDGLEPADRGAPGSTLLLLGSAIGDITSNSVWNPSAARGILRENEANHPSGGHIAEGIGLN